MATILVVGAHPDDIELGVGGAVASLIAGGDDVILCDVTSGEPTPHGTPEIRKEETAKANAILKVRNRINLDMPNRWLEDSKDGRIALAEVYREVRPDVLLIPYFEDAHPDHVSCSKMAHSARFIAKYTKTDMKGEPFYIPQIFYYLCIHLKKFIKPSLVFDISETIDQKMEAIRTYHSQFFAGDKKKGEQLMHQFKSQSAYYGSLTGVDYGEPLVNVEEVGIKSFDGLLP